MAATSLTIVIDDKSGKSQTDRNWMKVDSTHRHQAKNRLLEFLGGAGNSWWGSMTLDVSDAAMVAATGTVTCASAAAADTVTVNGVTFTAVSGTPAGNQFKVGVSDTADAASLVAGINASTTANIKGCVTATSALGVVTLTSSVAGYIGNCQTLASSNGTRLAVSGARLSGGTGGTSQSGPTTYNLGG